MRSGKDHLRYADGLYSNISLGRRMRAGVVDDFQDVMINKLDALTHSGEWRGELQICVGYETADGRPYRDVPRNEAGRIEWRFGG